MGKGFGLSWVGLGWVVRVGCFMSGSAQAKMIRLIVNPMYFACVTRKHAEAFAR